MIYNTVNMLKTLYNNNAKATMFKNCCCVKIPWVEIGLMINCYVRL